MAATIRRKKSNFGPRKTNEETKIGSDSQQAAMTQPGTRMGLVRCEHCGRQFNPHSGARHIPWCAKQQSENRKHRLSQEKKLALERYKWRISYKPTNHFGPPAERHSFAVQGRFSGSGSKKSPASINSSATLSSPSAGSINSLVGGSSVNGGYNSIPDRCAPTTTFHRPARATSRAARPPLKRSISSLTLTKQKGTLELLNGGNSKHIDGNAARTKSTNDVSHRAQDMSEIVENLARRMEEIYAQNQLLLARISRSESLSAAASSSSPPGTRNRRDSEESAADSEPASMVLSCHHCKSSCLGSANYCHKCGCKLHTPSSTAESPG